MNDESVKVTIEEALKINKVYHSLKIKNFNDFTTLKTQNDETFINKMKFVEKLNNVTDENRVLMKNK